MKDETYYIVTEKPALIRSLVTKHLSGISLQYLSGILIYFLLAEIVPNLVSLAVPGSYFDLVGSNADPAMIAQLPYVPTVFVYYVLILGGALALGRTVYVMMALRNRMIDRSILLEGMPYFAKATLIYLFQMMVLSFGLMLFIVPGIIGFYVYSQAMFIAVDEPKLKVSMCLKKSRKMMTGNIMNLFRLDLSYLSMLVLGFAPTIIVVILGGIDTRTLPGMLAAMFCRLTLYFVMGHVFMARATFYELIRCKGFRNFRFAGEKVFRESQK